MKPVSKESYSAFWSKDMRNGELKKLVYYVQSGVLATEKTDPCAITIKFKAPLDDSSDDDHRKEINYEEFRVADELKLLKTGEFERYAHIQCLKICHYV